MEQQIKDVQIEEQVISPLYILDKDILTFTTQQDISHISNPSIISQNINLPQCNLTLTNLSNTSFIVFKVQANKNKNYKVVPSNGFISPNSSKVITFYYYSKEIQNTSSHKFKIRGFEVNQELTQKDPKIVFDEYAKEGKRVKGNTYKRMVAINEQQNFQNNASRLALSNIQSINNSNSNILNNNEDRGSGSNTSKTDNLQKEQLENLKLEYYKLKHYLNIIIDKYKNLKAIVDVEKKNDSPNINDNQIGKNKYINIIFRYCRRT